MKRVYILPGLAVLILVLVIVKVLYKSPQTKQADSKQKNAPVNVDCYLVRDTMVHFPLKVVGFVKPNEGVDIVSEISARITGIHFVEGSQVVIGQLLFQLDDAELQASFLKLQAQLEFAKETESRNKSLLATGGLSQHLFDEAVTQRKVLEAETDLVKAKLAKTKILAPFSGKAGLRNVSSGAFVNPGSVLCRLEDHNKLKIDFTVPESRTGSLHLGQQLKFKPEGMPQIVESVVIAMEPSVNTSTGNLRVLALVLDSPPGLLPGRTVSMEIQTKSIQPSLYLPSEALLATPSGYTVYVVEDGKAKVRKIVTGLRSEGMVEVIHGIQAGEHVLVTGFMKIKPDVPVKILNVR